MDAWAGAKSLRASANSSGMMDDGSTKGRHKRRKTSPTAQTSDSKVCTLCRYSGFTILLAPYLLLGYLYNDQGPNLLANMSS